MRKNNTSFILLAFLVLFGCNKKQSEVAPDNFEPRLIAIAVKDIATSIQWYTQKLGFVVEKDIVELTDYHLKRAFLKLDDFHLEIIEYDTAYKASEILPTADSYIGGMFKIGFLLHDIQRVYNRFQEMEDVEILAGIGELPENSLPIKWPSKYFLVQDPDGNYIQFFDSGKNENAVPWLFMVTVENLENAISWYTSNLGFNHHQTIGTVGNRRAILERNDCVLELFGPTNVIKSNNLPADSLVLGFKKIAFGVNNMDTVVSIFDKGKVEIAMPLSPADDFDWANQSIIVKDPEGNWTQLFDLNK